MGGKIRGNAVALSCILFLASPIIVTGAAAASRSVYGKDIAALQSADPKKIHRRAMDRFKENTKYNRYCLGMRDSGSCWSMYDEKVLEGGLFEAAGDKAAALRSYESALSITPFAGQWVLDNPTPARLREMISVVKSGHVAADRETLLTNLITMERQFQTAWRTNEREWANSPEGIAAKESSNAVIAEALGNFSQGMQQIAANNYERQRQREEERDRALREQEARSAAALAASNQTLAESNRQLAEQQQRLARQRDTAQRQSSAQQQQFARSQRLAQQQVSARPAANSQPSSAQAGQSRNTGPYSFTGRSSFRLNQGHSIWDVIITNHTNRDLQCQVVVQGSMYAPAAPGRLGSPSGLTNRIVQGDHFSPGASKRFSVVAPTKGSWSVSGCTLNRALDRMPNVPLHRISVNNY